jgi:hypothetical protein
MQEKVVERASRALKGFGLKNPLVLAEPQAEISGQPGQAKGIWTLFPRSQ